MVVGLPRPGGTVEDDPLLYVLRTGARQMLTHAIEAEVAAFLAAHADQVDDTGRRRLVRNGHAPERTIQTGIGPIAVRRPKVRDRGAAEGEQPIRFTSAILPAYLRRTRNIEELLPWLYLKGLSTGQFEEALTALLGPDAPGLSATTVRRLVATWQEEHERWHSRDLSTKRYIYVWADGVYFAPRLEHDRQCILVLIGADASGKKELLAIDDGFRESEQSWYELLVRLRDENGLAVDPELATGDGALGFWKAAKKVWPITRQQRCWVHKAANVLNKLPKSVQQKAKADLHAIYEAENRSGAEEAFDRFLAKYQAKYDKAAHCLAKDREVLLAFYDFPAEHWKHIRTANPIESTFATVRLRTDKTKGCLARATALALVFKLARSAERHWRRLDGSERLAQVIEGVRFRDGAPVQDAKENAAA
ncbi:MAG: IS256 family transposase [Actinomycetota bacterium]|nr:IS256 family transposase [Actinomycetota bacterium]